MTSATTVSSTGSVTRRRSRTTPAASTHPTAAPPAARTANCPAPCSSTPPGVVRPAAPATASETAIWNSTRLVASLNRLSACTSAWTFGGSESRRPSALTATGSVLASTAPRTNAMLAGIPATAPATAATAAADASTRPTARTSTGRQTASRSRHGNSSLAAYSSGGSTTRLTTSGVTRTGGTPGSKPTTSPAITSREGAGMLSRPAKAATTVPSTTRNKMVSTARTSPTFPSRPRRKSADQTSRRAAASLSGHPEPTRPVIDSTSSAPSCSTIGPVLRSALWRTMSILSAYACCGSKDGVPRRSRASWESGLRRQAGWSARQPSWHRLRSPSKPWPAAGSIRAGVPAWTSAIVRAGRGTTIRPGEAKAWSQCWWPVSPGSARSRLADISPMSTASA